MNRKSYAVVIGLNDYSNGIQALKGATNDATAFKEWLLSKEDRGGKLPKENVFSFIDGVDEITDFSSVTDKLARAIALDSLDHGEDELRDRLYVYMAGHGITLNDPGFTTRDLTALLLLECSVNNFSRHIAAQTIRAFSSTIGYYKEVILIMDCCRDMDFKTGLIHFWNDARTNDLLGESDYPHFYEMYATKARYKAREFELRNGHFVGYFTESLLRNLKGAVDSQGKITFSSVRNAIHNDFSYNKNIKPQIQDSDSGELVFSGQGEPLTSTLVINFIQPAGATSRLIIRNPKNSEGTIWLRNQELPFQIDGLSAGLYTLIRYQPNDVLLIQKSISLAVGQTLELDL